MLWPRTRFLKALKRFGWSECSWAGDTLLVGLPPDRTLGRWTVITLPRDVRKIAFLQGPLQADLIRALARSTVARDLTHLTIATSHDYAERKLGAYDFRPAIAALKATHFPQLESLSLGNMEQLFNGHRYFGTLGDISHVFDAAPKLTTLNLHGQCALGSPITHHCLTELFLEVDDIGVNGGPISRDTLDHLLTSNLPALTQMELSLADGTPNDRYALPDVARMHAGMPRLKSIHIDCLSEEGLLRLQSLRNLLAQ